MSPSHRILAASSFLFLFIIAAIAVSACSYGGTSTSGAVTVSGSTADVSMHNITFDPSDLTVNKGTTVTWTNNDSVTHTVTSDTDLFDARVDPGKSFSFTFNDAGIYAYHCTIHSGMTGTVTVK